ncbi:MAG: threonine/serine exporter family protein [Clostridia bacterium]
MFNGSPRDFASSCVTGVLLEPARFWPVATSRFPIYERFCLLRTHWIFRRFARVPTGLGEYLDPIIIGALMPLVSPELPLPMPFGIPSMAIICPGVAQGVEAALTAVSIAAGVSLILHFYAFTPLSPMAPAEVVHWFSFGWEWPVSPDILFQTVCAFGASLGFSILFNASRTHLICCGIAGACSWFLYAVMLQQGFSPLMANFIAVLV